MTEQKTTRRNVKMKRNGKTLKTLPDGAPRRMADGKNAFRKMSVEQRVEFLEWMGVDSDTLHLGTSWLKSIARRWEEPNQ